MFDIYSQRLSTLDTGPGTREIKMRLDPSQISVPVLSHPSWRSAVMVMFAPVHSSQCLHSWPKICLWRHIDLISRVHLYVDIAFLLSYHRFLSHPILCICLSHVLSLQLLSLNQHFVTMFVATYATVLGLAASTLALPQSLNKRQSLTSFSDGTFEFVSPCQAQQD
jgi:hypothetical protein